VSFSAILRLLFLVIVLLAAVIIILPERLSLLQSAFIGDTHEAIGTRSEVLLLGLHEACQYPICGVPFDYEWPGFYHNVYPHILAVYYAALFGLPVGLIGALLLSALLWSPYVSRWSWKNVSAWEAMISGMFAGIVLVVTSANNCPTPILLWWCWALAIVPHEDTISRQ
jgi:hypothetical protein